MEIEGGHGVPPPPAPHPQQAVRQRPAALYERPAAEVRLVGPTAPSSPTAPIPSISGAAASSSDERGQASAELTADIPMDARELGELAAYLSAFGEGNVTVSELYGPG